MFTRIADLRLLASAARALMERPHGFLLSTQIWDLQLKIRMATYGPDNADA